MKIPGPRLVRSGEEEGEERERGKVRERGANEGHQKFEGKVRRLTDKERASRKRERTGKHRVREVSKGLYAKAVRGPD